MSPETFVTEGAPVGIDSIISEDAITGDFAVVVVAEDALKRIDTLNSILVK